MWGILARFHRHEAEPTQGQSAVQARVSEPAREPDIWWDMHRIRLVRYLTETRGYHVESVWYTRPDGTRLSKPSGYMIPATDGPAPQPGDEVSLLIDDGFILRMLVNGVEVALPWIEAERSA